MKLLLDLLAAPLLLLAWFASARTWADGGMLFLLTVLVGTAAGGRLAWAAFRWGRRRKGVDPASPAEPVLRFLGCSVGALFSLALGFTFWALGAAFFRRLV